MEDQNNYNNTQQSQNSEILKSNLQQQVDQSSNQNTIQKDKTITSWHQTELQQYPQQKIDILKSEDQEQDQQTLYSQHDNIQKQLKFRETSIQQKIKHKKTKQELQILHDFHADNFSYCQVQYKEQPTITNKRSMYIRQTAPLGEYGTTSISFQKERHRINPKSLKKYQAGLIDFEQEKFQEKKCLKQGVSFRLSRDQIKYGADLPNQNPGVGQYNAFPQKFNNFQFTFGKKTPNPIYNVHVMQNPGPGKYDMLGCINKEGEYPVDKFRNTTCGVFQPATTRRFQKINKTKPGPGRYNFESINNSGLYFESKLQKPKGGAWSLSERFKQPVQRVQTPGPGAHKIYKDVDDNKILKNKKSNKKENQKPPKKKHSLDLTQPIQQSNQKTNESQLQQQQIQSKSQAFFHPKPSLKIKNKQQQQLNDKSVQQQEFSNFENQSFFKQQQVQIQQHSNRDKENVNNSLEKTNKNVQFQEQQKTKQHNIQQRRNLAAIQKSLKNNYM